MDDSKCKFEKCNRKTAAFGYCFAHYRQFKRTGRVWPIRPVGSGQPSPYPGKSKPIQIVLTEFGYRCLERGMKRRKHNITNYVEELIREDDARAREKRAAARAAAGK